MTPEDTARVTAQVARMELTLVWLELESLIVDCIVFPPPRLQRARPWTVTIVGRQLNQSRPISRQSFNALSIATGGKGEPHRAHVGKAKDIIIDAYRCFQRVAFA